MNWRSTESSRVPGPRRLPFIAILLLLLLTSTANAQQSPIRAILDSVLESSGVPALAAAVVTRDSIVVLDAVGLRRGALSRTRRRDA